MSRNTYCRLRLLRLVFLLFLLLAIQAVASVFGDGDPENGIEDQRVHRLDLDSWPVVFNAVGKLVCNQKARGSGVLLDIDGRPAILTAGHVLQANAINDCEYQSGANRWERGHLVQTLKTGHSAGGEPLPIQYQNDWVLVAIEPWANWQNRALSKQQIVDSNSTGKAFLVGYDVVSGQLKAHISCNFGSAEQSSLLEGTTSLIWDDCHSTGGASGGALFVETPEGMGLLGIRIGSLFVSEPDAGTPPKMGDPFDLQAHINVCRVVADILGQ